MKYILAIIIFLLLNSCMTISDEKDTEKDLVKADLPQKVEEECKTLVKNWLDTISIRHHIPNFNGNESVAFYDDSLGVYIQYDHSMNPPIQKNDKWTSYALELIKGKIEPTNHFKLGFILELEALCDSAIPDGIAEYFGLYKIRIEDLDKDIIYNFSIIRGRVDFCYKTVNHPSINLKDTIVINY